MATRFGAVSPAQSYATKVRWLVACLVSVILVLVFTLIFIAQNTDQAQSKTVVQADAPVAAPVDSGSVEVLVAISRIEEGARFEDHMFRVEPMPQDKVPVGVMRSQARNAVIGRYAKRMISANMPVLEDDLSETQPLSSLPIPPGYRAATIILGSHSAVDGFAKPNSRVDVLWAYTQDGKKKVATIARFVKVLSVDGKTGSTTDRTVVGAQGATVTLLVTEKDAKKIELARTLGELSLSLVGEHETTGAAGNEPDTVTINDLIGRPANEEPAEVATEGVMYTPDPKSGRQLRYVLRKGRWALDRTYTDGAEGGQ